MTLGLCCHWVDERGENIFRCPELKFSSWRTGKYSEQHVRDLYLRNIDTHIKNLPILVSAGLRHFRLTSTLFTLTDQVPRHWWDNDLIRTKLACLGKLIVDAGLRCTFHPGQFVVLSSDTDRVVEASVVELELHAWIFDAMGMPRTPFSCINVHGGKSNRSERLIEVVQSLSPAVRSRLTFENDESSYSVADLLRVHVKTGVPVVFDVHHHTFNDSGVSMSLAHSATLDTWPRGIRPVQHLANTEPGLENSSFSDRRKHSQYIHSIPEPQLTSLRENTIDVEIEAKQKNLALFKLSHDFSVPL
jgi:UV DNA damage endonuclease